LTVATRPFGISVICQKRLTQNGYNIIGEFSCRAFSDYYKIFKLFGGVNKGHPNEGDLEKAKVFALQLLKIRGIE